MPPQTNASSTESTQKELHTKAVLHLATDYLDGRLPFTVSLFVLLDPFVQHWCVCLDPFTVQSYWLPVKTALYGYWQAG